MTTNKPEIVAYMRPAYGEVVSQEEYARWEHEATRNPGTPYGEWRKNETIEYSEPLIRLNDYEALQAECNALRDKTSMSLGVGDGTGNLFVYGDSNSINHVLALIFECEKLRKDVRGLVEALEQCRFALEPYDDIKPRNWVTDREGLRTAHELARKALEVYQQEK